VIGYVSAVDADQPPLNNIAYFLDAPESRDNNLTTLLPFPFHLADTASGKISMNRPIDRELEDEFRFVVRACSPDRRCDAAAVRIVINDVNDNDPTFVFPGASNDTVLVGTDFYLDEVIVRLVAFDEDAGSNGLVGYELITAAHVVSHANLNSSLPLPSAADSYFRLDESTGEIFSRCEILHPGMYVLPVAAVDGGGRRSISALYIIVNASLPVATGRRTGGRPSIAISSGRLTTVIIIAGTTCPVVALLLAAICIVTHRRERRGHTGPQGPPSPQDAIYFRKSLPPRSAMSTVTSSSTSPRTPSVEYATLGRAPKLVPSGSVGGLRVAADRRSLTRSTTNMATVLDASVADSVRMLGKEVSCLEAPSSGVNYIVADALVVAT
jgi:hypothetical protein